MQVFRLVNSGFVDRVIAFNSLPEQMLQGTKTMRPDGLPRHWLRWLREAGSMRDIVKCVETVRTPEGNLKFKYEKVGTEPCFYALEYKDINADKDKWQEINDYVRRTVDAKVRLKDSLEDMAVPLARDCYSQLELEPEETPVIQIDSTVGPEKSDEDLVTPDEDIIVTDEPISSDAIRVEPKRRGRPKKVAVEA